MARPNKFNLQYFPLDVDFFDDHKVISIEETAQIKGGYIALRLMAMVYADKGYYLEWPDKFEFTAAKRIGNGVTGALVGEIFKLCLKHELFSKEIFDRYRIVTSAGIQKRWLRVMNDLRRKVVITSEYWLVSSEETGVSSEETQPPDTESTQKEIKVNEIKVKENSLPQAAPAAADDPEPFWQKFVDIWFEFGKQKFGEQPSFKQQDPKILKRIIQLLKKRAALKKAEWSEETGPRRFLLFLEGAFCDAWLSKHFLLKNLETQFDQIIQRQNTAAPNQTKPGASMDVDYLLGRYLENQLDAKLILPAHFDELQQKNLCKINGTTVAKRIDQLMGTNKASELELIKDYQAGRDSKYTKEDLPALKRTAVLEYFATKKAGHE